MSVHEKVTQAIIEKLEKVNAKDYEKPWFNVGSAPLNAITRKTYRGINFLLLSCNPYQSSFYATYKQWSEKGCQVRKGSKGHIVVFWNFSEYEDQNGEEHTSVLCKHYTVFNSEQVDGDFARGLEQEKTELNDHVINQDAEKAILHYLKNERIKHEISDRACYSPSEDRVSMPLIGQFKTPAHYYSVFFHEMTHSTGAKTRLDRELTGGFGSNKYAQEELVAELGAAMLCAIIGVSQKPMEDHACYIASWLTALKNDKRFIFQAASQAQKASDFIQASAENYQAFLDKQIAA